MSDVATKQEWLDSLREEGKRERQRLREIVGGILGAVALALLILLSTGCATVPAPTPVVVPVHIVDTEGVKMRMLPTPCADPVSMSLAKQMSPVEYHARWRATSSDWKMRDGSWQEFAGCWLEVEKEVINAPDAVLFFTFSDGTSGQMLKGQLLNPRGLGA